MKYLERIRNLKIQIRNTLLTLLRTLQGNYLPKKPINHPNAQPRPHSNLQNGSKPVFHIHLIIVQTQVSCRYYCPQIYKYLTIFKLKSQSILQSTGPSREKSPQSRIKANADFAGHFLPLLLLNHMHFSLTSIGTYPNNNLSTAQDPMENGGCSGGYPSKALLYVRHHGLSTEATYPYISQNRACQRNRGQFRINSVGIVSGCVGLMNGIPSRPLLITFDASNWAQYHSGVFNNCAANISHCVLLVETNASGVWKIKNSWGTSWGQGGFIRLAPGNTCGVCVYGDVFIA